MTGRLLVIAPLSRAQMDANHAAAARRRAAAATATVRHPQNVPVVLDLGRTVYFMFQGRPYGVPPLPWRVGLRLQEIITTLGAIAPGPTGSTIAQYRAHLAHLPRILWRHCRPVGRRWRLLRRLGLLRNPFRRATEAELLDVARFFLSCRTRSTVVFPPPPSLTAPPMSSTSS